MVFFNVRNSKGKKYNIEKTGDMLKTSFWLYEKSVKGPTKVHVGLKYLKTQKPPKVRKRTMVIKT